ncbi:unnamed protein product [Jaminaea pallidilutea]
MTTYTVSFSSSFPFSFHSLDPSRTDRRPNSRSGRSHSLLTDKLLIVIIGPCGHGRSLPLFSQIMLLASSSNNVIADETSTSR